MISSRRRRTLAIWLSRNFWPPKPGSTVMMSTMSNSSRMSKIGSTGSAGRTAKQALQPISRSWRARRTGGVRRTHVEADGGRAELGVFRSPTVRVLDHQVHVDRQVGDLTDASRRSARPASGSARNDGPSRPRGPRSALAMALRSRSRLQKSADRMLGAIAILLMVSYLICAMGLGAPCFALFRRCLSWCHLVRLACFFWRSCSSSMLWRSSSSAVTAASPRACALGSGPYW